MRMLHFEVTYLHTVLHTLTSNRKAKLTADSNKKVPSYTHQAETTMAKTQTVPQTMRAAMVTEVRYCCPDPEQPLMENSPALDDFHLSRRKLEQNTYNKTSHDILNQANDLPL